MALYKNSVAMDERAKKRVMYCLPLDTNKEAYS